MKKNTILALLSVMVLSVSAQAEIITHQMHIWKDGISTDFVVESEIDSITFSETVYSTDTTLQTPDGDTTKLWPAQAGGKWGYINARGNFVIVPLFQNAIGFSCGYALVSMDNEIKFIDKNGIFQATPFTFDGDSNASSFYYNYSTIEIDRSYGLMNNKFQVTIQPYFSALYEMGDNGLVVAKRDGSSKYEYVNAKGETQISAMYEGADSFKDGVAVVVLISKYGAIDKSGNMIIQPTYQYGLENMGEGLIAFGDKNGKRGILDKKGNMIQAALYKDLGFVYDGLILCSSKGEKYGYLDTKGAIVIPEMYYRAYPFFEGYAWVKQSDEGDGAWMSIDKKNSVVFYLAKGEYPMTGFHNGLALVATEDGYKYVNEKGNMVYSWIFDDPGWAPKKAQCKQMSFRERMEEFTNMTLNLDTRKL